IIPGVDVNAVIGGFAGALLFVLWAHDLTIARRLGYLLASWVGGYYAATEAVGRGATQFSGLPALVTAALIVTILIGVLDWMIGGRAPAWLQIVLQRIVGMIGGRKDG
ncbi:phage holin family protein, partial [Pseudomonas aeruginosa]|nr:phage holin family protein [Pseudomonas aeruginosa]